MPKFQPQTICRLLRAVQALFLLACIATLLDIVFAQGPDEAGARALALPQAPASQPPEPPVQEIDTFSPLWERDLRQVLKEPPPPAPKAEPKPPPPLPVQLPQLLATFVEDDRHWGLFVDESGKRRVRPSGAVLDQFTIIEITPGKARIQTGSSTFEIEVPKRLTPRNRSAIRRG